MVFKKWTVMKYIWVLILLFSQEVWSVNKRWSSWSDFRGTFMSYAEWKARMRSIGIKTSSNTGVVLSNSIETLEGLSSSTKRALKAGGILTIRELFGKTKTALLQIPEIGEKRFAEIKKNLVSIGLWSEYQEILSLDIETLEGLSPRTQQILKNMAIYSVDDIINMIVYKSEEFLSLDKKIQDEIDKALDLIGSRGKIRIDVTKVLRVKIESVKIFSTLTKEVLKTKGINTVGDLSEKTKPELLQIPGIDERVFNTIKEDFVSLGVWSEHQTLLAMDIETLEDLSSRTRQILKAGGIYDITTLSQKTESELLEIPNIGKKRVVEIKTCLDNFKE